MKENILKKYGMTLIKGSPNITITGGPGISIKTDGILIDRVKDSNVDSKVIGANVTIVETFDNGEVSSRKVYANKRITESDIEKITSRCGFGKLDSFIFKSEWLIVLQHRKFRKICISVLSNHRALATLDQREVQQFL